MKKFLFVYPPYCFPISPYIAPPLLSTILNKNGFNASCIDLNAKYYKKILNKDFLNFRFNLLKKNLNLIKNNLYEYTDKKEKTLISKSLNFFFDFIKKEKEIISVINNVDNSIKVLKSNYFYNINKFEIARDCIQKAEELNFYTFFISSIFNTKIGYDLSTINYFVKNKKLNPYYEYYLEQIQSGLFDNYDYIMLSQAYDIQNFGTWTLAYLLKKYTNTKVVLGGNYPSRLTNTFKSNKKIFDEYFDFILTGLGQESIIEFAEFTHNKRDINKVSGLIYSDRVKIHNNVPKTYLTKPLNRTQISFEGINFDDYLIPEIVVPVQVSNGCPWGKCTFCVFHAGKSKFQIVPPKQIAKEFKYLNEKYGIRKFEFVDESLSPNYYYEFAKEILNLKLDISYYGFARFDDGFTSEILKIMYKSGFKMFEWGYETPSKRVMEIYNKGINIDSRLDIMKEANKSGIWNYCLTIADLPFEAKDEILNDYDVYLDNIDLFNSRLIASFHLFKNAPIFNNAQKYNMTNIKDNGNLSIECKYERNTEKNILLDKDIQKKRNKLYSIYKDSFWYKLLKGHDEYLFLYVSKYGIDKCKTGKF